MAPEFDFKKRMNLAMQKMGHFADWASMIHLFLSNALFVFSCIFKEIFALLYLMLYDGPTDRDRTAASTQE